MIQKPYTEKHIKIFDKAGIKLKQCHSIQESCRINIILQALLFLPYHNDINIRQLIKYKTKIYNLIHKADKSAR